MVYDVSHVKIKTLQACVEFVKSVYKWFIYAKNDNSLEKLEKYIFH